QEGIIVEANQAWAELFGKSTDDAVNAPLMDLFDPSSHVALKGAIVACAKGQWTGEPLKVTGTHGDGSSSELTLLFEQTSYEGEPAVKLSVPREAQEQPAQPEELVERTVHQDQTTGLYHRRRFLDLMLKRLETNPRGGVRALAYVRPDKFGEIAGEIGPLASEDLLGGLAEILRFTLTPKDIGGRFGGNVFTLLIERGTMRDIEAWAEHALQKIADHIFEVGNHTLSVTCTIGIAEAGPMTERFESLILGAGSGRAGSGGRE